MARRTQMTYSEAERILGLSDAESYDTKVLRKRYHKAMMDAHPDAGGKEEDAVKINNAKDALDRKIAQSASGTVKPEGKSSFRGSDSFEDILRGVKNTAKAKTDDDAYKQAEDWFKRHQPRSTSTY